VLSGNKKGYTAAKWAVGFPMATCHERQNCQGVVVKYSSFINLKSINICETIFFDKANV